jgi:ubiquinone/menaquinone biosynthesis C-methylase UbiE
MKKGGRILEGGCGLAEWVKVLKEQGYESYGIDFSKKAIECSLEKWPDLNLIVGDLKNMPYEDSFFDGIMSLGAIEHDLAGPKAALAEMFRVLRSKGVLYCTVPCANIIGRLGMHALREWRRRNRIIQKLRGIEGDPEFFQFHWTPKEYREILEHIGFDVIKLVPLNPETLYLGKNGGLQNRVAKLLHRKFPWFMPHMIAAICYKP